MSSRRSKHGLSRDEYLIAPHGYAKRGVELPQTKLSAEDVQRIRGVADERERLRQHITDTMSNAALAKQHDVSVRAIERVLAYETHVHVLSPLD